MRTTTTIKDSSVLVTGANRGIGRALAEEVLRRGARRVYAGTRTQSWRALLAGAAFEFMPS